MLTSAERHKAKEVGIAVLRQADGRYRVLPPTVDRIGDISIRLADDLSGFVTPSLDEVRDCIRRHLSRFE